MALQIPQIRPCPFCAYLNGDTPCAFVYRGSVVSAFLNPTQYERGALLVVPNVHVSSVLDAQGHVVSAVYHEVRRLAGILVDRLHATGLSVFQNNGTSAGQTVPHYHVHLVPRYSTSDPARRFREADFPETALEELYVLAADLRGGDG